jgi:hypothetical protein
MTLPEPLKTVVELEQLHHEWYLTTKAKTNNVRHLFENSGRYNGVFLDRGSIDED